MKSWRGYVKRSLDFGIALCGLIVLAPLLLGIAVAIGLSFGLPVLFRQQRPGRHGKLFTMYKFRTMNDLRDESGILLPDEQRLSGIGQFLRKTSLDELPELWNVLRGDMSLVGPRPLLTEYLDYYTPEQSRRHDVRPGITGWAQVNGRNAITWEEKFALDLWYIDHMSLSLDLKILWMTLFTVFKRQGIRAADHATMPKFRGSVSSDICGSTDQ